MTLQQLRYITMVAEKGTISEAAKELFISQPSLTNAIRELEQEMQVTIFQLLVKTMEQYGAGVKTMKDN